MTLQPPRPFDESLAEATPAHAGISTRTTAKQVDAIQTWKLHLACMTLAPSPPPFPQLSAQRGEGKTDCCDMNMLASTLLETNRRL